MAEGLLSDEMSGDQGPHRWFNGSQPGSKSGIMLIIYEIKQGDLLPPKSKKGNEEDKEK